MIKKDANTMTEEEMKVTYDDELTYDYQLTYDHQLTYDYYHHVPSRF